MEAKNFNRKEKLSFSAGAGANTLMEAGGS